MAEEIFTIDYDDAVDNGSPYSTYTSPLVEPTSQLLYPSDLNLNATQERTDSDSWYTYDTNNISLNTTAASSVVASPSSSVPDLLTTMSNDILFQCAHCKKSCSPGCCDVDQYVLVNNCLKGNYNIWLNSI